MSSRFGVHEHDASMGIRIEEMRLTGSELLALTMCERLFGQP